MRKILLTVFAAALGFAPAAHAGTLANGEWKSAKCVEPAAPASLLAADKESAASHLNELLTAHNIYAGQMQSYMDCLSQESQTDSESLTKSAQATIDAAHAKVTTLGAPLQPKK